MLLLATHVTLCNTFYFLQHVLLLTRVISCNTCYYSNMCYFLQHVFILQHMLLFATYVTFVTRVTSCNKYKFCITCYLLKYVLLFQVCCWKYQLTKYLWIILDIPWPSRDSAVFVFCLVTAINLSTVVWESSQDGGVALVVAFFGCSEGKTKPSFL